MNFHWLERLRLKEPRHVCPLCQGAVRSWKPGRTACTRCQARERARLMGLILPRLLPEHLPGPVVHAAPEKGVARLLFQRYGGLYRPVDYDPHRYRLRSPVGVGHFDMTKPFETFRAGSLGALIHSHVLEHVFAPVPKVLSDLNALLAPGGWHVVMIPIAPGAYQEDINPALTRSDRERRFGQYDHVRIFGRDEIKERFLDHFAGMERVRVDHLVTPEELDRAAIPRKSLTENTGDTLYVFRAP